MTWPFYVDLGQVDPTIEHVHWFIFYLLSSRLGINDIINSMILLFWNILTLNYFNTSSNDFVPYAVNFFNMYIVSVFNGFIYRI